MLISEKYYFFDDETSPGRDGYLLLEGETELKDTKKDYEEPVLEIATEIEKKKKQMINNFLKQRKKLVKLIDF